ncbi:hypothetical protein ASG43_13075 [Aureimonas sp. Leaf454]|nr:hypothetical protein ASG43_13075 [Aureimonas sp. Leaf454]
MLAIFTEIALEASSLILQAFGGDCRTREKADASPVTDADVAAERLIAARLRERLPSLPLVAEEAISDGHVPAALGRRFVLVDPIDGTREFVGGIGDFTVNIALVEGGRPRLGVVVAPAYGEIFTASPAGAFKGIVEADGTLARLHPIRVRPRPKFPVVLVSRSRATTPDVTAFLARHLSAEVVPVGSSLKFCRIAEGMADLYPCFGRTMEWDTAAGQAVLEAAGGSVLDLQDAPLVYDKRDRAHEADFANAYFVASGGPAGSSDAGESHSVEASPAR